MGVQIAQTASSGKTWEGMVGINFNGAYVPMTIEGVLTPFSYLSAKEFIQSHPGAHSYESIDGQRRASVKLWEFSPSNLEEAKKMAKEIIKTKKFKEIQ